MTLQESAVERIENYSKHYNTFLAGHMYRISKEKQKLLTKYRSTGDTSPHVLAMIQQLTDEITELEYLKVELSK